MTLKTAYLFFLVFVGALMFQGTLSAQNNVKGNTAENDITRFEDYSGQPFYFKENHPATLYIKNVDKPYELESANYNLITNHLEYYKKDKYTVVHGKRIDKVTFDLDGYEVELNKIASFPNGFVMRLYESDKYLLLQNIETRIDERMYNTPGKNILKKLIRKNDYFILKIDNVPHSFELKKKEIVKVLGADAEAVLNDTSNKLKTQWDLVNLLKKMEVLGEEG